MHTKSAMSGDDIFLQCIQNQQNLAKSILKHIYRIPEKEIFLPIEIVVHPRLILQSAKYNTAHYRPHLESICAAFGCSDLIATVSVQHVQYVKLISNQNLQEKYADYWKISGRWDPLGVIESFMNPKFEIAEGMEDYCFILAKIGLIRFTQNDTERVVKTIRKTETRFAGYDEIKEKAGKRDRAREEIFIRGNHS